MKAAYVLAGGMGRRFGGDKLVAIVDGETSIARIVSTLYQAGFTHVYLVTRSVEKCRLYMGLVGEVPCVVDERVEECGEGPGLAIYTALIHAYNAGFDAALIVAGDMPWLEPWVLKVVESFLGLATASTILHGNGFLEPLVQAHKGDAISGTLDIMTELCRLRGYFRPTDALRSTRRLALVGSGIVCSHTVCYAHINTVEELKTRVSRNPLSKEVIVVDLPAMVNPCKRVEKELSTYRELGIWHLVKHAEEDLTLCRGVGSTQS